MSDNVSENPENKPELTGKEKSRKNLIPPWSAENQPANPGRKKGSISIISHIRRLLEENDEEEAKKCALSLIHQLRKGNPTATKEIMGRIDGPLTEKTEITGADGQPIKFQWLNDTNDDNGPV